MPTCSAQCGVQHRYTPLLCDVCFHVLQDTAPQQTDSSSLMLHIHGMSEGDIYNLSYAGQLPVTVVRCCARCDMIDLHCVSKKVTTSSAIS